MNAGNPTPPWKGLDTIRKPLFLGYAQTERMVAALLDRAERWSPDAVVGIARGGLIPATMAATTLALPLASIAFERGPDRASWIGLPASGRRILLVDDGCSSGRTMAGVRTALLAEGRECLTLTVVHDPDCTAYVPDLSHPMRELWRFPWERGEATPRGREWRAHALEPGMPERNLATEAPFVGVDLEVALGRRDLADPLAGLPLVAPQRAVVIGRMAECERADAEASLDRWPHGGRGLEYSSNTVPDDPGSLAQFKAAVATRWGCTHFIEGDARQAILIAAAAPHLIVTWWSATDDAGYLVGAAAQPAEAALIARS